MKMDKFLIKVMAFMSLFPIFSQAEQPSFTKMLEISKFAQVLEHVTDKDTILLVSIDNTLLKSPLQMGERAWFYHRKNTYVKNGMKDADATSKALAEWTGILNLFGQQVVANDIVKTIDQIQKKHIKVMGISSRGLGLASLTTQHLAQAGINLGRTSGIKQDVPLILGEKLLLLRNGILFTSGVGKAIALKKLADLTKVAKPKKIVMVSHDEHTLKLVAEGMRYHAKDVAFVPLRYSLMDEASKNFNSQAADKQFESLMNVLSNEQATMMIQKVAEPKTSTQGKK